MEIAMDTVLYEVAMGMVIYEAGTRTGKSQSFLFQAVLPQAVAWNERAPTRLQRVTYTAYTHVCSSSGPGPRWVFNTHRKVVILDTDACPSNILSS